MISPLHSIGHTTDTTYKVLGGQDQEASADRTALVQSLSKRLGGWRGRLDKKESKGQDNTLHVPQTRPLPCSLTSTVCLLGAAACHLPLRFLLLLFYFTFLVLQG